ncbi:MAG TPA: glycosyltransferase [Opitutaceae bacterium]|nr:glycosyltransferase [Opitutaceae bacterium]
MPDQAEQSAPPHVTIVVPVFDDWAAFARLLGELDAAAAALPAGLEVLAVDDGSLTPAPSSLGADCRHLRRIEVLRLRANLGHQRALAIGLADCVRAARADYVVTMDADGEDRPADLAVLLEEAFRRPGQVVVAQRARRTEGLVFRAAYLVYKLAFRFLTGRVIAFGNFAVLPVAAARRLVFMPECWNHLAATIVKSRLPILGRPTARGTRYAGRSTMNLVSLVVHGFSAFSVFIDTAITRLLLFFGATSLAAVVAAAVAVALRFGTDLAIPGWATNVFGLSMVVFFQSLTLAAVVLFSVLSSRSSAPFLVGQRGEEFVESRSERVNR